jgi:hypothetical protein
MQTLLIQKLHLDKIMAGTYAQKPLQRRICVCTVILAIKMKTCKISELLIRLQRFCRRAFSAHMPAMNCIFGLKELFNSINLLKIFFMVLLTKIFQILSVRGPLRYQKINFFTIPIYNGTSPNCII